MELPPKRGTRWLPQLPKVRRSGAPEKIPPVAGIGRCTCPRGRCVSDPAQPRYIGFPRVHIQRPPTWLVPPDTAKLTAGGKPVDFLAAFEHELQHCQTD